MPKYIKVLIAAIIVDIGLATAFVAHGSVWIAGAVIGLAVWGWLFRMKQTLDDDNN